jgi:hypothetical protein
MMANVAEVEVVVAHHERATLRVGDVFLKIDAGSSGDTTVVSSGHLLRRAQGPLQPT